MATARKNTVLHRWASRSVPTRKSTVLPKSLGPSDLALLLEERTRASDTTRTLIRSVDSECAATVTASGLRFRAQPRSRRWQDTALIEAVVALIDSKKVKHVKVSIIAFRNHFQLMSDEIGNPDFIGSQCSSRLILQQ